MRRPGWLAALLVLTASASLSITASAVAAHVARAASSSSPTYSPHLMLREQTDDDNCNTTEEQYNPPTTVDIVLGNPHGEARPLRRRQGRPDQEGPHGGRHRRSGRRLLPGPAGRSPRRPCPARGQLRDGLQGAQGRRQGARRSPTPTSPPSRATPGLVVQYWFFYYFNQFNDVHEGDWEGMQIAFDADTPARGARAGAVADRPLPARRRRAGGLGRHEGPEGRHPSDRLSGGRVARDLLRRRDLHPERLTRLGRRLRQHLGAATSQSDPAAGHRARRPRRRAASSSG